MSRLLCWLGIHQWTGRYDLPELSGVRIRHCSRCFKHAAWVFGFRVDDELTTAPRSR